MAINIVNTVEQIPNLINDLSKQNNKCFRKTFIEFHKNEYLDLWEKELVNCEQVGLNVEDCINEITKQRLKCYIISKMCYIEATEVKKHIIEKYADCFCSKEVKIYIYADLKCGAGWATNFHNDYVILLGVKSIIDLRFDKKSIIKKILYHEFGHIIHWLYRNNIKEVAKFQLYEYEPIYMIYSEGFAQRIASQFLGKNCWFQSNSWINWCEKNIKKVFNEYLKRIENMKSVKDFFNILYGYQNNSQIGYYLGKLFIEHLEEKKCLQKIAQLSLYKVKKELVCFLEK